MNFFKFLKENENLILKPQIIKSIWDNKGKSIDRYTVIFKEDEGALGLSDNPNHPNGVAMFLDVHDFVEGEHLGDNISWESLPKKVQSYVVDRISLFEEEGEENKDMKSFKQHIEEDDDDITDEPSIDPTGAIPQPSQETDVTSDVATVRITIPGIKELRDGLTEDLIRSHYSWILNATFENVILGLKSENIVLYGGTWIDGEWAGGIWETGIWKDGKWSGGFWKNGTWMNGTWLGGTWFSGEWQNGTWIDGEWKAGNWKDGVWKGGIWEAGNWANGLWERGTWVNGTWRDGTWKDGIWKDGTWSGGTWMNGTWLGGNWSGGTWKMGKDKTGEVVKSPPKDALK
jgi:hypothetical protein